MLFFIWWEKRDNFDLELESGIVINPVLENETHYKYWLGALPFLDNIEKKGIVIE